MRYRTLLVIGSNTSEDCYGVTSGERVGAALTRSGWLVDTLHAGEGRALLQALLSDPPDLVVPVGFGPPCEDGHVYAAAQLAGVPCAGPTPAAGSLMQDKSIMPGLVASLFPRDSGIRCAQGVVVDRHSTEEEIAAAVWELQAPLVVKPALGGSSHGLSVEVNHADAVAASIALLPAEGKVLVQTLEERVVAEISCTVLDTHRGPRFLSIAEIRRDDVQVLLPAHKFGPDGLDRHIIPARLPERLTSRIRNAVLALHRAVGAAGLTRTDILICENDEIVILEMNAIPGLLETSIACDAALADGISFDELCVAYATSAFIPRSEVPVWAAR